MVIPRPPLTLVPEVLARDALELMNRHQVDELPVCTLMGILLGSVHREDLAAPAARDTAVGLLRRI